MRPCVLEDTKTKNEAQKKRSVVELSLSQSDNGRPSWRLEDSGTEGAAQAIQSCRLRKEWSNDGVYRRWLEEIVRETACIAVLWKEEVQQRRVPPIPAQSGRIYSAMTYLLCSTFFDNDRVYCNCKQEHRWHF